MLVPATSQHFAALIEDSAIAPAPVLEMLRDLADSIRPAFDPAAWLIVEDDAVVGLLSLVVPYAQQSIRIGYGIAPAYEGLGITSRAVGELLNWARDDARIARVTAETNHENIASQRVLEHNHFARIGERIDAEDGALIVWEALV